MTNTRDSGFNNRNVFSYNSGGRKFKIDPFEPSAWAALRREKNKSGESVSALSLRPTLWGTQTLSSPLPGFHSHSYTLDTDVHRLELGPGTISAPFLSRGALGFPGLCCSQAWTKVLEAGKLSGEQSEIFLFTRRY